MTFRSAKARSTSQKATRFSVTTDLPLPLPCPPTPTTATLSSALGGMNPLPPSTWRGTIVGRCPANAAPRPTLPASSRNARREMSLLMLSPFNARRSRSPLTPRHRRNELVQPLRRKRQCPALLGALIRRHEHSHDIEAVVEGEQRLFLSEEHAHEVPILGFVTIRRCFVRD